MEENTKPKTFSKEWFSDPKNVVITIVASALMCLLFYGFATYILPWLVTVTWNLVNLILGVVCVGILLIIFTSKKFWRSIKYLSELIGRYTLGLVIEMNPFNILEMKIERAKKDQAALQIAGNKVSGKKIELETKMKAKQNDLQQSIRKAAVLKQKGQELIQNQKLEEAAIVGADYEVEATKVAQLRGYIESVNPIVQDLGFLETHYKKVYKLCGAKIKISINELELGRDQYEAVMSGAGVARAAWKAIVGNEDLNADAERALAAIQRKVSNSLAEMKNTMELTSDIIRNVETDNFTRAREGMDLIRQMQLENITEYVPTNNSDWNSNGQFDQNSSYTDMLLKELEDNK